MKLRRIMCPEEYNILISGGTLEKSEDFSQKMRSSSVGFCFFPTDVPVDKHVAWIPGVRAEDVICTFECDDSLVTKSWGEYEECQKQTEYCTMQYSLETFTLKDVESVQKYGVTFSREKERRIIERAAQNKTWKSKSRT